MARAIDATPEPGYMLKIEYDDGTVVRFSLEDDLHGEVFEALVDPTEFARVHIDELGAVEWANGASLSPEFVSALAEPVGHKA